METILVVDDEAAYRELLTEILVPEGYRVLQADSAELALTSVVAQPPDLILVDIRMPGMNGFEFCRRLKTVRGSVSTPLIFMSAAMDANARVEGLVHGAVDFISKPFQGEELLARVKTYLARWRLREYLKTEVAGRTAEINVTAGQLQHEIV